MLNELIFFENKMMTVRNHLTKIRDLFISINSSETKICLLYKEVPASFPLKCVLFLIPSDFPQ